MDKFVLALSITAALLHIAAFVIYNRQMSLGTSTPISATWTLWAVLTIMNSASYLAMSHDLIKSLLPLASSAACLITFVSALTKGKFEKADPIDRLILRLGLLSGLIWWGFDTATFANLILQVCIALSFIPTFRGTWSNPKTEKPLPWFIWGSAYIFSICVVCLRWRGQPQDFVYPITGLIMHVTVGMLSLRRAPNALNSLSSAA
ncbi:MAG: hypothetical protein WCW31_04935 [Patescibacteria group bacterium]|jgi:hypothetical protein